jgi:MYXO-CTERM domain-containing protein
MKAPMIAPIRAGGLLAALLSTLAVGCAMDASPGTGKSAARIIDGVASGIEDNSAVWVGILTEEGYPRGACTGVLLADNVVLTARHCVSSTESGGIACSKDGTAISGGDVRRDHLASSIAVVIGPYMSNKAAARGQEVFHTGATNLCNNDIAIVVLDRHIPDAVIAPVRLKAPPVKGEKLLAVGWGVSNTGGRSRKRRVDIPITAVGPVVSSTSGIVSSNEFAIGEGICSGDSGGPAYSMETGAVLGVVSRGGNGAPYDPATDPAYTQCVDTAEYKTHNIYTRVDTMSELIYRAFEVAGGEPWVEGSYDPRLAKSGETCEAAEACRSGICHEGGCVDPCTDGVTCPEGFTCQASGEAKVCVANPITVANEGAPGPAPKKCSVSEPGAASSGGLAAVLLGVIAIVRRRRSP